MSGNARRRRQIDARPRARADRRRRGGVGAGVRRATVDVPRPPARRAGVRARRRVPPAVLPLRVGRRVARDRAHRDGGVEGAVHPAILAPGPDPTGRRPAFVAGRRSWQRDGHGAGVDRSASRCRMRAVTRRIRRLFTPRSPRPIRDAERKWMRPACSSASNSTSSTNRKSADRASARRYRRPSMTIRVRGSSAIAAAMIRTTCSIGALNGMGRSIGSSASGESTTQFRGFRQTSSADGSAVDERCDTVITAGEIGGEIKGDQRIDDGRVKSSCAC